MENKKKIGTRIANARKKLGLSKVKLSEKSGFGASRIGNWEAGIRTPKPEQAKILEPILGVSAGYLLGLTDLENEIDATKSIPLFAISDITNASDNLPLTTIEPSGTLPLPKCCEQILKYTPFALRVEDESMSPQYKKGNLLVFIPEKLPTHNDIVVATVPGLATPVVRKYFVDSSNSEDIILKLVPYNPEWITNIIKDTTSLVIHGVLSNTTTVYF